MTDETPNDSRVAIVTGAAGALGTAMCERFVRDGIRVVVADVAIEPARGPRRSPRPDRGGRARGGRRRRRLRDGRGDGPDGPRLVGPDRHHGQQRGHRRGVRPDLGDAARSLAAHDRHRPDRRLPWLPGRPADDARTRLGPDRQHLLDRRQGRQAQPGRLRGGQGRRHRPDQGALRSRSRRTGSSSTRSRPARSRAGTGRRSARRPWKRSPSAIRSGASGSRPRSRRSSPSCPPTNARSRPARSSISRAAAPATDRSVDPQAGAPDARPRRAAGVPEDQGLVRAGDDAARVAEGEAVHRHQVVEGAQRAVGTRRRRRRRGA